MGNEVYEKLIMELSEGNPGGLRVAVQLYKQFGMEPIRLLQAQGITGSNIWVLFKDVCGGDELEGSLDRMITHLREGTAYASVMETGYSTL